jgi:hypothetical protein
MLVQLEPSFDVWTENALPDAVSQLSTTVSIVAVAPRSTWIHCGSLNALDQRVPALPSVAYEAGVPAFSVEDAVVGLPCESSVPMALAACGAAATARLVRMVAAAAVIAISRVCDRVLRGDRRDNGCIRSP